MKKAWPWILGVFVGLWIIGFWWAGRSERQAYRAARGAIDQRVYDAQTRINTAVVAATNAVDLALKLAGDLPSQQAKADLVKQDIEEIGSRLRSVTETAGDVAVLAIARQNGSHNRVSLECDSENRIETGSIGQAQLILCSDLFYTKIESLVLAGLLDKWRERSVTILIGDGGRAFVPKDYREVLWEESVDVDADLEGREKREVRILRY